MKKIIIALILLTCLPASAATSTPVIEKAQTLTARQKIVLLQNIQGQPVDIREFVLILNKTFRFSTSTPINGQLNFKNLIKNFYKL
jgi:heat shock protein HslJ